MEIYNPALDNEREKDENISKNKMEILTKFILEEANNYIKDFRILKKYEMFRLIAPCAGDDSVERDIEIFKKVLKSLLSGDTESFKYAIASLGMSEMFTLSEEMVNEIFKGIRLKLYKSAEEAFDNK